MPLQISLLGAQSITDDSSGIVRTRSLADDGARRVPRAARRRARRRASASRGCSGRTRTDAQALTNLRRELHHLRRTLGDDPSSW